MLGRKGQKKYIRIQLVVMLCMSKVSKDTKNMLIMFLLITFLIFNQFSIQKKFWKAGDLGLSNCSIKFYVC